MGIEVYGPSGLVDTFKETPMSHRTKVRFLPTETGDYKFKLTYNQIPLSNVPSHAICYAITEDAIITGASSKSRASSVASLSSTGSGSDQKVVLTGKGLAYATIGQPAEFTIDGSRAGQGLPEVTMSGINSDLEVVLTSLGNHMYKATYTAESVGVFLLNVMWSERLARYYLHPYSNDKISSL